VLEYPFLRYYSKEVTGGDPENPQVQRYCKGSISLRGAVAIDQEMKCEKKHRKFTDTRFKLVGCSNNKEFILQAKDSHLKDEWIKAIQSNIEYANPGKKIGGVCYEAKVSTNSYIFESLFAYHAPPGSLRKRRTHIRTENRAGPIDSHIANFPFTDDHLAASFLTAQIRGYIS